MENEYCSVNSVPFRETHAPPLTQIDGLLRQLLARRTYRIKCTISFVNGFFCHTLDNCFATKASISWYTLTSEGIGSDGYTSVNQHEIDINPCHPISLTFHHFCIGLGSNYRCCSYLNTRDRERPKCFFRRQIRWETWVSLLTSGSCDGWWTQTEQSVIQHHTAEKDRRKWYQRFSDFLRSTVATIVGIGSTEVGHYLNRHRGRREEKWHSGDYRWCSFHIVCQCTEPCRHIRIPHHRNSN